MHFRLLLWWSEKQAMWTANTDPVEDLKPIDVFDAECGHIYLATDCKFLRQRDISKVEEFG
jgi:hypothetical protein|tara:strand:+ start:229 stop:411 length:183 start_codon:yes stop_codon:yes gene_type:complete